MDDVTITSENRAKFTKLGCERVKVSLLSGFEGGADNHALRPIRDQALAWLSEQDRKREGRDTRRFQMMFWAAFIAAVAGIAAAVVGYLALK